MSTIRMVAWGISEVAQMDKHTFQCVRIAIRKELQPYRLRLTQAGGQDYFTLRRLKNRHRSEKVYAGTLQNVCIAALCTIDPEGGYKPPPEDDTDRWVSWGRHHRIPAPRKAWIDEGQKIHEAIERSIHGNPKR